MKTKAELLAQFADNTTGDITAARLRDFVNTSLGVYGGLFICEGSGSQNIASNSDNKITQWTAAEPQAGGFDVDPDENELVIPVSGVYMLSYHITYNTTAEYPEFFRLRIAANGVALPGACNRVTHFGRGPTPDIFFSLSANKFVTLAEDDVITLQCVAESLDSTRTLEVKHAALQARLIG
jgi:hypothetical protein